MTMRRTWWRWNYFFSYDCYRFEEKMKEGVTVQLCKLQSNGTANNLSDGFAFLRITNTGNITALSD